MCLLNISGLSPAIALLSTGYLTIDSLDMTDINVSDCIVIILVYYIVSFLLPNYSTLTQI